ncbi:MAG TPA: condensation domain-containing protein, partial [Thermoanaerobaculia bacterium]|nr:condensation domain-containing protein [Thermoanaerobaculia bacterium]
MKAAAVETVTEFLSMLATIGVKLSADAGQLNCYAQRGTITSDIKAGILRHKPEILALLESNRTRAQAHVVAATAAREFPLSAGQKGLYILHKLNPGMSAYNVPLCFRINSAIDLDVMAAAWQSVLEQFPILTARVVEKEGSLYHRLDESCRTTLQQRPMDVTGDDERLAFLKIEAKKPFDLNRGPLTRIELFTQGEQKSVLLLIIHHIIFDGVSAVVVLRSLLS